MSGILNEFHLFFTTNNALITFFWAVISFGLGTWFGHWLARSRDKRKEFNAVSDPIELFLMKELKRLELKKFDYARMGFDFDNLTIHLPRGKRKAYEQAVEAYLSALKTNQRQTSSGQVVSDTDYPAAIVAVKKLLSIAKHQ